MDSREILIGLAIKYNGNWKQILEALNRREYDVDISIERYMRRMKCKVLTFLDPNYPYYLKEQFQPPFVLFYYGDISLIADREKNVAVVGSRLPAEESVKNTETITKGVAKKFNIVSGLAMGLDRVAHESALSVGGRTIAVLGNGIEYCYPSANTDLYEELKKTNLVISEYFGHVPPDTSNFPQRNRLIVMFSRATIVGEANHRSGSVMTANLTESYYNPVLCVPSSDIENSACDLMIQQGCHMILSAEDVFDYLGV